MQIVETRIFLRGTVMKASSHEKHSKQQWKKQKKSSDPWARSGRGLAGDMGLNFFGFLVFCFFWFFGFLVCVWIAIADVPSRDCQALSVVALEARSIHYSTAMFAMT